HNIRVNSVGPTYVMTPPLRAKVEAGQRDLQKIMAVHALDRLPEPRDIADAIAYLCSDQAAFISGVLLPVDAGWLAAVSYRTYAGGVLDDMSASRGAYAANVANLPLMIASASRTMPSISSWHVGMLLIRPML